MAGIPWASGAHRRNHPATAGAGRDGVDEDLPFHRSVAEATDNPYLVATVRYLGERDAQRHTLRDAGDSFWSEAPDVPVDLDEAT